MSQQLSGALQTVLLEVGQGNPGGLRVALELLKADPLALGECLFRGLTGARLLVAYKDVCGEDLSLLIERLSRNSQGLAEKVNEVCL